MVITTHRIQLLPNNKQRTYFRKAIGCCRLAYNWGLAEWTRRYKDGERGLSGRILRNDFNKIRGEQFPFTYEVTKYATAHAFDDLNTAFTNFFKHRANYPKPHKKKDNEGGFYIGADQAKLSETHKGMKHLKKVPHNIKGKYQYVNIPNLGYVKMSERLRFIGKIVCVNIVQDGDKFFASFKVQITNEEYRRTHPHTNYKRHGAVGIDFGLKNVMTLSDGIAVKNPRIIRKHQKKISKLSRKLSKRQYAKNKQERRKGTKCSNNYIKLARQLRREYRHVANIRRDFIQKLTSVLTTTYEAISIEDLDVKGMVKRRDVAKSIGDVSFREMRRQIEYKSIMNGIFITHADRFYPSSKICSCCGHKRDNLTLKERFYMCPVCGNIIDRDYNAACNLLSIITNKVGVDYPKLTPVDLAVLQSRFALNKIATCKVETGKQRQLAELY